jgi:hypothetical protein
VRLMIASSQISSNRCTYWSFAGIYTLAAPKSANPENACTISERVRFSGVKPAFQTCETFNLRGDLTLKAFPAAITLSIDQLVVGKAGLPPLIG